MSRMYPIVLLLLFLIDGLLAFCLTYADLCTLGCKIVTVKNPLLLFFVRFPISLRSSEKSSKKKNGAAIGGLVWYGILWASLVAILVFLFSPAIPCEPFRISLGRRYRAFVFEVDTLNQKLPFLWLVFLCAAMLTCFFIQLIWLILKDEGKRKNFGAGWYILMFALVLLMAGIAVWAVFMMIG